VNFFYFKMHGGDFTHAFSIGRLICAETLYILRGNCKFKLVVMHRNSFCRLADIKLAKTDNQSDAYVSLYST